MLTWLNLETNEDVDELYRRWSASDARMISAPESKPWGLHEFTAAGGIRMAICFASSMISRRRFVPRPSELPMPGKQRDATPHKCRSLDCARDDGAGHPERAKRVEGPAPAQYFGVSRALTITNRSPSGDTSYIVLTPPRYGARKSSVRVSDHRRRIARDAPSRTATSARSFQ